MSGAHDVPRRCDTQSLIDKGETKILGLRGLWWEAVMCHAEPVAAVTPVSDLAGEQRGLSEPHRHTLICQNYRWD